MWKAELVNEFDLFFIEKELRNIDDNYRLFFNKKLKQFEVYNLAQQGDKLALILPFDKLDYRTAVYVRETRCERMNEIVENIELQNLQKQQINVQNCSENVQNLSKNMINFAKYKNSDLNDTQIQSIKNYFNSNY